MRQRERRAEGPSRVTLAPMAHVATPARSAFGDVHRVSRQTVGTRDVAAFLFVLLAALGRPSVVYAGQSFDFPFRDEEYLLARQHDGGRAYVPKQVSSDQPAPLVVFLHGVNRRNRLHMWLGSGPADLRTKLEASIEHGDLPAAILAAPSQTRDALWPTTLWTGIDLEEFVTATELALAGRARIARDQVIVAGHSGAGCNLEGGILKIAADRGAIDPIGIVALDTCLDGEIGQALGRARESTRIATYWQSVIWPRKVVDFAIGFSVVRQENPPSSDWFEHVSPKGRWPHDALVAPSLLQAMSVMLAPVKPETLAADRAGSAGDR